MASSSLRSKILQHALPHIPEHSFTIQPLVHSLRSLPSTSTDTSSSSSKSEPETVTRNTLDILFGSELNARQELVKAWEQEGLRDMVDPGSKSGSPSTMRAGETEGINGTRSHGGKGELGVIADLLARRLEYSSHIGEHLVEAQALLSAPGSSPSIPVPTRTLSILSRLLPTIPPLYSPPSSSSSSNHLLHPQSNTTAPNQDTFFSSMLKTSNDRIPLFRFNPLGPLSYAWKISDAAWYHLERQREFRKGAAGEPVGAGPEWYTSRLGLGLVYLASESHLLHAGEGATSEIRLSRALRSLDSNLKRYEQVMGAVESGEQTAGDALGYLGFIGRAWAGIIRSRGW